MPHARLPTGISKVVKYLLKILSNFCDNTYWLMQEMNVTQWGIVSVIFVIAGFMCMRSKL
ncbi:MAG: hypothetical protein Aurels2KO_43050 [Aureliella sp.]